MKPTAPLSDRSIDLVALTGYDHEDEIERYRRKGGTCPECADVPRQLGFVGTCGVCGYDSAAGKERS